MPSRTPRLTLLFLLPFLVLLITACSGQGVVTSVPPAADITPIAASPVTSTVTTGAVQSTSQPPYTLRLDAPDLGKLPADCLKGSRRFTLKGIDLPRGGLEPGMEYVFCALGAADGSEVTFTLKDPDGVERTQAVTSATQGEGAVAPLFFRPTPNDKPGKWLLSASAGDATDEIAFKVSEASGPYIVLSEPLPDSPRLLRAAVGGLKPNSTAQFALYNLDAAAGNASYLIAIALPPDPQGRADIELDVTDLPAGSYLLVLLPEGVDFGDPPTLHFPDQQRLAIATAITRNQPVAEPSVAIAAAPQPAPAPGGIPQTIQFDPGAVSLPTCAPASAPALDILEPARGEMGDWWVGCVHGFAASEAIDVVVTMANGQKTPISVTAGADGAALFRWYSAPSEGPGQYEVTATSASGASASASWNIELASRPHILVFPHAYQSDVGGDLNLSGFSPNTTVDVGLYQINDQGQGALVKQWQMETNKFGLAQKPFEEAFGLDAGQYAVIAQSAGAGQAFTLPGLDIAASAIDFFGYDQTLDPRYDAYSLYLGRAGAPIAEALAETPVAEAPATTPAAPSAEATPSPAAAETPAAAPTPATAGIPATLSIPADNSERPTCPGAAPDQPAICLLPTSLERGSFAYIMVHGIAPRTPISLVVKPPKGAKITTPERADANGFADFHWYALDDEPLGEYKIQVRAGKEVYDNTFQVVEATAPRLVVQPRAAPAGAPVIAAVAGFQPNEKLTLGQYGSTETTGGSIQFQLLHTIDLTTNAAGGAHVTLSTKGGKGGDLHLVAVFRSGQDTAIAQAVYSINQPLFLRYPFAWGQNFQEGQ